jgi:hypothetical protein
MAETLRQQQSRFALAISNLILQAYDMGYEVTLGDAYRDPRLHGEFGVQKGYGRASSQHKRRLAIDLNLFKNGRYLSSTEAHRPLGEWWEAQHPDAAWGGRFNDGNHYSFTRGGFK